MSTPAAPISVTLGGGRAELTTFFDDDSCTAQHVLACAATKRCAVVDAVLDFYQPGAQTYTACADRIVAFVRERGYTVEWILETHPHADHISSAPYLQKTLGGKIGIGAGVRRVQEFFRNVFDFEWMLPDGSQFDHLFADNEQFTVGQLPMRVIATPGHTPACISFYAEDLCVFVGDTIFMPDGGSARCDFPNGSAEQLYDSIHGRLYALPDHVVCCVCHDYRPGGREPKFTCTMGEQKTGNIHITTATTRDEFVKLRNARDATLGMPKYIVPSIQTNMIAGKFPPPDKAGKTMLVMPMNILPRKGPVASGTNPSGDTGVANVKL